MRTQCNSAPIVRQIDPDDDPPDVPTTPHTAYVVGWAAARRGDDLANVIYDAALRWPMGGNGSIGDWCELVTCACIGFWIGEGGAR